MALKPDSRTFNNFNDVQTTVTQSMNFFSNKIWLGAGVYLRFNQVTMAIVVPKQEQGVIS